MTEEEKHCKLVPTEGGYQKTLDAILVRESASSYFVSRWDGGPVTRYEKKTLRPFYAYDRKQFPSYRLEIPDRKEAP